MFSINNLLRENIKNVKPYTSARDEYTGTEGFFLDANENPIGSATHEPYNRYPDPHQKELKAKIAQLKRVSPSQIFLGNGSDEAIDLLIRATCVPAKDNIIIMPPTYGMYEVSAAINDIKVKTAPLTSEYMIDTAAVLNTVDDNTKLVFVCSPNNPTANALKKQDIIKIITSFKGLIILDEAYIDFAPDKSLLQELAQYPNLVIMQTFSKAWGMASLRLGMAFASEEIIKVLTSIKPPYNISGATQSIALKALSNLLYKESMVEEILDQREELVSKLNNCAIVKKVFPSDANFLLVKFKEGLDMYPYLVSKKVITRDRSKVKFCEDSLRITVGTSIENNALIQALEDYQHL